MGGGGAQETLTMLFTDVEGSTAFRTRAGDAAGNQVMAAHERLVAEQVRQHDGRLVKSLGDGCLAVFPSPRRALECAVAVQQAALSSPLRVRMGLNAGEVTLTGDDVFGTAVNAAARMAAKAQGGEILVSDVVRQLIGSNPAFELRDRGRVRLRGFPERWRLHEVVWRTDPAAGGQPELTPFVARAAELARLLDFYRTVFEAPAVLEETDNGRRHANPPLRVPGRSSSGSPDTRPALRSAILRRISTASFASRTTGSPLSGAVDEHVVGIGGKGSKIAEITTQDGAAGLGHRHHDGVDRRSSACLRPQDRRPPR